MASIRTRITVTAVAFFFVVLAAAAVVVVVVQWRQLLAAADRSLSTAAADLAFRLESEGADPDAVLTAAADPLNPDDHFALLQDGGGEGSIDSVVSATPNLAGLIGGPGIVDSASVGNGSLFRTVRDIPIDDDSYRIVARPMDGSVAGSRGPALLVVGENIDDPLDGVRSVVTTLAVLVPAVTAAFGLAVWFLVGRTLSPVEAIRRQVEEIGPRQLDHRVPVPATGDEISRLAVTMNSMLDRVEQASQRQERFVGDASHELRLPLTRMRTSLEVDLAGDGDLRPAAETALRETVEMQALVDDLLLLARLDDHPPSRLDDHPPSRLVDLVDLDVIVDQEVERLRRHGRADGASVATGDGVGSHGTSIDMSSVSAAVVAGRREQMVRIVRNLLDNAVAHADTRVVVSLADGDDGVVLTVDDDGPGVPVERRDVIFDRFARLDEARHSDHGGSGLGLAIVRELVRGHGGAVACSDSPLGGARFEVVFPAEVGRRQHH